jgi:hypothetical protein
LRNPLREICTVGSVRGETPGGAMVDLHGHEAGNGGHSQGKPTAYRDSSTRRDGVTSPIHSRVLEQYQNHALSEGAWAMGGWVVGVRSRFHQQRLDEYL